jgi:hypothetical protein
MGADRPLAGSGRALRLDPHNLPAKYVAPDSRADGDIRDVEIDRERVVLRRKLRGIPMKVGVRIAEFAGVTMRTLPPEGAEPAAVAVVLEHHDSGLSVPLFIATDGQDALAEWKCWSRVLGVPLLVDDGSGDLREPFQRIGRVALGKPSPRRRRRGTLRSRRPAILMRRKPGRAAAMPTIHRGEREIIARN